MEDRLVYIELDGTVHAISERIFLDYVTKMDLIPSVRFNRNEILNVDMVCFCNPYNPYGDTKDIIDERARKLLEFAKSHQ